jgi:AraC-like DNA-binding protein
MIVWGPGFTADRHSHHCVQLLMVMRGMLRIRTGPRDKWKSCGAALVRPDAVHEVQVPQRSTLLIAFVDVESELGAALCETIPDKISRIPAKRVAQWRAAVGHDLDQTRVEQWVRKDLLTGRRAVRIHPAVNRVLKHIRQRLGREEDFSLKSLAAVSGLSPSRLMHVFTDSMGVPLRPYILWLRLQRGSCELMNGATATEAAHIAGFADGAHLTRTFRRMLGTTPSELELRRRMSQAIPFRSN